jgi:hypothetical protein
LVTWAGETRHSEFRLMAAACCGGCGEREICFRSSRECRHNGAIYLIVRELYHTDHAGNACNLTCADKRDQNKFIPQKVTASSPRMSLDLSFFVSPGV